MSSDGGRANANASASKSKQLKRKKNAPRSRKDPGWEYATDIDGDSKKTKCKFCSKVITDNASAYKAAGAKLMEKRQHLFWTPCAAHFLDLMLEDLEKKLPIHKRTIAKGGKITNYIYGRMSLHRRLFLYLELNQAMEKIKSNFSNIEKRYKPLLNIIEKRWNDQMSRPLYYAAYWLNPKVHLSENFDDTEKKLKLGLFDCVERLSKDRDESLTIMQQLDTFHHAREYIYHIIHLYALQFLMFFIYVVFKVHSKKRNRLLQKKMNGIVYVMYNSKLLRRQAKDIEHVFDEIDSDDEWLAGEDGEVENEDENADELVGVEEDEATFENESTHEPSFLDDEHRFEEEFVANEDEGGDKGNNEEEYGDENAYYDEDEGDKDDEEDEELDFNVDPKDLM
ncbi:hypothetical protein LINPERPRIM_LOCUS6455 [Linum perenne]